MKVMIYRTVALIALFYVSTSMVKNSNIYLINSEKNVNMELLYNNVWGTIYNAEISQCDSSPNITADGSIINVHNASKHRWIAISQEMLNDMYRASIINKNDNRFKGKIKYGDTVWIDSPINTINGWWVVRDAKNKVYTKSIDFLQTKNDRSLFKHSNNWNGKFQKICIYKLHNSAYIKHN